MEKKEIKILIVDDVAYMRMLIKQILENIGFLDKNIKIATDGVEALQKCKEFLPDIVVLDLILPKISGLNLIELLLNINYKIKIMVCSIIKDVTVYQKALSKGAIDWIEKPINENLFKSKIEKLILKEAGILQKDAGKLTVPKYDFSEKIGIKLDINKNLQILNLYGKLGDEELKDLKETIMALQIYQYKNVILNFNGVSEFKILSDDIIRLKNEVEKKNGKFVITLLNDQLKDKLSVKELANSIVKTEIQALRQI